MAAFCLTTFKTCIISRRWTGPLRLNFIVGDHTVFVPVGEHQTVGQGLRQTTSKKPVPSLKMKYKKAQIKKVYISAHDLIESGRCTGDDVLEITKPFFNCTYVEGVSDHFQRDSIGLLFALTGDGYRVAKRFDESANWYKKASEFTCCHGEIYAFMVLSNELKEHYATALGVLDRYNDESKKREIMSRAINYVLGLVHCIFDAEWRLIYFQRDKTLRGLQDKVKGAMS